MEMQNPAKAYLSRYQHLMLKCEAMERSISYLREQAESITIAMDPNKVQSSPKIHDPIAEAVAAIADTQERLAAARAEAFKVLDEITQTILRVDSDLLQSLLLMRYVDGMRWEAIAKKIGYEERQTYRLHGVALNKVKQVIDCQ